MHLENASVQSDLNSIEGTNFAVVHTMHSLETEPMPLMS